MLNLSRDSDEQFFDVQESWQSPKISLSSKTRRNERIEHKLAKTTLPIPKQIEKIILHNINKPVQIKEENNELAVTKRRSFISFKENTNERMETNDVCRTESDCAASYIKDKTITPNNKINVHTKSKPISEFNNLYLQQELASGNQAIWVARFSSDGYFFAAGGEDCCLRVWEVTNYLTQRILY